MKEYIVCFKSGACFTIFGETTASVLRAFPTASIFSKDGKYLCWNFPPDEECGNLKKMFADYKSRGDCIIEWYGDSFTVQY